MKVPNTQKSWRLLASNIINPLKKQNNETPNSRSMKPLDSMIKSLTKTQTKIINQGKTQQFGRKKLFKLDLSSTSIKGNSQIIKPMLSFNNSPRRNSCHCLNCGRISKKEKNLDIFATKTVVKQRKYVKNLMKKFSSVNRRVSALTKFSILRNSRIIYVSKCQGI